MSLIILSGCTCWGASGTFSDRQAFLNACSVLPGVHEAISFDSYPWGPTYPAEFGPFLTVSNVTFGGRYLLATSDSTMTTSGAVLFNFDSTGPLHIMFDHPVWAFGAHYGSGSGAQFPSFTATLTLDSGQTFTFESPTNPETTFFGFIVDEPIMRMTFSDGGKFYSAGAYFHGEMIKDVFMVREVPEPSSLGILWIGAAAVFFGRLWNRRA